MENNEQNYLNSNLIHCYQQKIETIEMFEREKASNVEKAEVEKAFGDGRENSSHVTVTA